MAQLAALSKKQKSAETMLTGKLEELQVRRYCREFVVGVHAVRSL